MHTKEWYCCKGLRCRSYLSSSEFNPNPSLMSKPINVSLHQFVNLGYYSSLTHACIKSHTSFVLWLSTLACTTLLQPQLHPWPRAQTSICKHFDIFGSSKMHRLTLHQKRQRYPHIEAKPRTNHHIQTQTSSIVRLFNSSCRSVCANYSSPVSSAMSTLRFQGNN
jgi:hypothetical protein